MRRWLLSAALLACGLGAAHAADLREAWLAARQHHPDMAAAAASQAVADARRQQANRLWNPTVAANASAGAMGARTASHGAAFSLPGAPTTSGVGFETSVDSGPGARWGVVARMPVYSPVRTAQERQLQLSADLADLQASAVQQQLMLQTAQQYFGAVLAQQQQALLRRQQNTTQRALAEAQDRFRLGDAPVTDMREAEARASAVAAQLQAADVDVQVAHQALAASTGWSAEHMPALHLPATTDDNASAASAPLAPLAQWLEQVERDNLQLRQQAQAVALAQQEAAKAARGADTTVDLIGQAGGDRLSGSGRWGSASNTASQYLVGVQVQIPLYTGGQREAKLQEQLRLEDKARADLDSARLAIAQQTRGTWLQLQAGTARAQALEAAVRAAQLRLQATELGRQVGDRTTLELLQAQQDAMQAESNLLQHRAAMVQLRLQLAALAGRLDEPALLAATDPAQTIGTP